MKILYSHRTRSADGQYVHVRALTDALAARGHEVMICGPGEAAARAAERPLSAEGGARRRAIPQPIYELAEFAYSAPGFLQLSRAGNRLGPDILYERYNLYYHAGVRYSRMRGLPLILEVNSPLVEERARHGGLALKGLARWSEGSLWRAADAILPVTGVLGRRLAAAGVDPARMTVVQNGVEEAFLEPVDGAQTRVRYGLEGRIVLGFTGFVRDWHRVDRALDFMAAHRDLDLHLLLVGDGPARADLEAKAQTLGLSARFTVTGVVQREAMPAHVAAFDVALQPAVVDYASPLKLFEYMASARAILAPASPNILEVIADGREAALFDPQSEAAFHAALGALVADAGLRARLGAAARDSLVRQGLTWARNAERVERIAEGLLARGDARRPLATAETVR